MRGGTSLPATLAALIVTAAYAQATGSGPATSGTPQATTTTAKTAESKPAEGDLCFFAGPTFGTDILNIGWNTSPNGLGVLPGLRAGFWVPKGFLAAEA